MAWGFSAGGSATAYNMHSGYQYAHERELLWRQVPWIVDRPPPGPGYYMVTVSVNDDGEKTRFVRLKERWDGERWLAGGYVTVDAWYWDVQPFDGVARERSIPLE